MYCTRNRGKAGGMSVSLVHPLKCMNFTRMSLSFCDSMDRKTSNITQLSRSITTLSSFTWSPMLAYVFTGFADVGKKLDDMLKEGKRKAERTRCVKILKCKLFW